MDISRSGLLQQFDRATSLAEADLVGNQRLGELSFADREGDVKRILLMIDHLRELPLEGLPKKQRTALQEKVKDALGSLEAMKNFTASQPDAATKRNNILGALEERYAALFSEVAPVLAYFRSSPILFESLEKRRLEALASIETVQASTETSLRQLQAEAEEIVASMRRAAADVGVSVHAAHFAEQAKEHMAAGKWWLCATIAIAVAAAGVAAASFYYYFLRAPKIEPAQGLQIIAAKLVLFSIFYFVMIWSSRNYRAHRHNYVAAKHRQNALSTFQAFVKATSDDTTRNAVLLRATEAIFSAGLSGYVPGEPEPQGSTQVLEIFRGGNS